ncbi:MAG: helix-turn-helix transcriptional regulator [Roseburia sp.]
MQVEMLDLIRDFYETLGIQILFFNQTFEGIEQIDYRFRKHITDSFDYAEWKVMFEKELTPGILYCMQDELYLNHIFFVLPKYLQEPYGVFMIAIGPVLFDQISSSDFKTVAERYQIPESFESQLLEFYHRIPQYSSYGQWITATAMFFSKLTGKEIEILTISHKDEVRGQIIHDEYAVPGNPTISMKALEDRYAMEHAFMTAVSLGRTKEALTAFSKFLQYTVAPRTPDLVRNSKNLLIVHNTLLRIAAQKGAVHPLHIDNLSAQLAIQIEFASAQILQMLPYTMIRKYCLLVQNYSRRPYSSLVRNCLDYIDFHYENKLSLNSLASMCSVSSSYLSSLFKKEVNMTLTDYINTTRIRQSLILLNSTSLSIQEIAAQCGFSDSNYFTRIFKRFQGLSPKNYRDVIRNSD